MIVSGSSLNAEYDKEYVQRQDIDLGVKQWACLDELVKKYENVDLSEHFNNTIFASNTWIVVGAKIHNYRWKDWFPETHHFPLMLLSKVYVYDKIVLKNQAHSTLSGHMRAFSGRIVDFFEQNEILMAERDVPFSCLSILQPEALQVFVQADIAATSTFSKQSLQMYDWMCSSAASQLGVASFMTQGASTPWGNINVGVHDWLTGLKASLGVEKDNVPYSPLTDESLNKILTHSLMILDDYGDTIIGVFDELEIAVKNSKDKYLQGRTITAFKPIIDKYSDALKDLHPLGRTSQECSSKWITDLQRLTQSACAWITLLTTGLRNVDMRSLPSNCCIPSTKSKGMYYLISKIEKVKILDHVIPVPAQTFRAVELAKLARQHRESKVLFHKVNPSRTVTHSEINDPYYMSEGESLNKLLYFLPNFFDFKIETINPDKEVSAHCGRSTLAGFIGANSNAAILILKKLFGHSNALMPEAYLIHNPLVIKERNKNILNAQTELAASMAKAVTQGKVAGKKGEQLSNGAAVIHDEIKKEFCNHSMTEMDMQEVLNERLTDIYLDRMTGNHMYAMLTPMAVVCLRTCHDTSESPCASHQVNAKRKKQGVHKSITDAMATLPDPANCVGASCPDALIGDPWSKPLLATFQHYVNYLKGSKRPFDLQQEAKRFVNNYRDILVSIYEAQINDQ